MMEAARRTAVRGPTFIRTLARLTAAEFAQPGQSLSDQLGQWIDWTQAVALSSALDGKPPAPQLDERILSSLDDSECMRVRAALTASIAGDRAFTATVAEAGDDYSFFRQRYLTMQQSMEAGVGRLRERLRAWLTHGTAEMARLAAVDAVMERALSRRERALLSVAPNLLGEHFERLREAARASDGVAAPGAWLETFRKDMQDVLLAELDVRLQPAEGLMAALGTSAHG